MSSTSDRSNNLDDYKLIVEGNSYGRLHGSLFFHEQPLRMAKRNVKILLQTERDIYAEGQDGKYPSITKSFFEIYEMRLYIDTKILI